MNEAADSLGNLIRRLQEGEAEVRDLLIRRLTNLVVLLSSREDKGDLYTTSDLAQSVFVLLLRRLERPDFEVRSEREILGYVHDAVRTTASKKRARSRALKRDGNPVSLTTEEPAADQSPADLAEYHDCLQAVRLALRFLSPQERVVLDRLLEGESLRQVAQHLGQSESNVRKIRDRAHKKLHDRLRRALAIE